MGLLWLCWFACNSEGALLRDIFSTNLKSSMSQWNIKIENFHGIFCFGYFGLQFTALLNTIKFNWLVVNFSYQIFLQTTISKFCDTLPSKQMLNCYQVKISFVDFLYRCGGFQKEITKFKFTVTYQLHLKKYYPGFANMLDFISLHFE